MDMEKDIKLQIFDSNSEALDKIQEVLEKEGWTTEHCHEHASTYEYGFSRTIETMSDLNDNMKADIKEIMHACGDRFDFIKLCNEAQEELDEAAFDLDQESKMNGV